MRPVERGNAPRSYSHYGDAIGDLKERLGRYCSYCERRLPTSLAVEHVAPKSLYPDRATDWNNFLLSCNNCNSVKGNRDVPDDRTLWPDQHNTVLALAYSKEGFVRVAEKLDPDLKKRATALIDLVGLDRHGKKGWPEPTRGDERWKDRERNWAAAEICRTSFKKLGRSEAALDIVLEAAKGYGFFSVWLIVFREYPAVKQALIEAFPGTAASCFDGQGNPIPRPGSVI